MTQNSETTKALEDYTFRSGKRAGMTYKQVKLNDPGFCDWVKSKTFEADSAMGRFREYLVK